MDVYIRKGDGFYYAVEAARPHITICRAPDEGTLREAVEKATVAAYTILPDYPSELRELATLAQEVADDALRTYESLTGDGQDWTAATETAKRLEALAKELLGD